MLVHGRRFSVTRLPRVVDVWLSGGGDRNDWRWSPPLPLREARGDSGEVVDDEDEDDADDEWPWLDDAG